MKAIVEVSPNGAAFDTALDIARRFDAGQDVPPADYHLHFESVRLLFSHLSGARMELLDRLRRLGACSVYALAKSAERNYSNVHRDVAALENLGLIERDEAGAVFVPFDSVEIRLGLAQQAA